MSPIGRRCARPDRPRAAGCVVQRAFALSRFALGSSSLALVGMAGAQQNLGFEARDALAAIPPGWIAAGAAEVTSDTAAADGARSMKVTRVEPGVTRVSQRVSAAALRPTGDRP